MESGKGHKGAKKLFSLFILRFQSSTVIAVLQIGLSVKCSLFNSHSVVFFFFCFVNVIFICCSNWVRNHNKRPNETKRDQSKKEFTDQNWMFKNFIATETNLTKYMNPLLETACNPEIRACGLHEEKEHYAQWMTIGNMKRILFRAKSAKLSSVRTSPVQLIGWM